MALSSRRLSTPPIAGRGLIPHCLSSATPPDGQCEGSRPRRKHSWRRCCCCFCALRAACAHALDRTAPPSSPLELPRRPLHSLALRVIRSTLSLFTVCACRSIRSLLSPSCSSPSSRFSFSLASSARSSSSASMPLFALSSTPASRRPPPLLPPWLLLCDLRLQPALFRCHRAWLLTAAACLPSVHEHCALRTAHGASPPIARAKRYCPLVGCVLCPIRRSTSYTIGAEDGSASPTQSYHPVGHQLSPVSLLRLPAVCARSRCSAPFILLCRV